MTVSLTTSCNTWPNWAKAVVVKRNNETSIEEITAMAAILIGRPWPLRATTSRHFLGLAIQHFAGKIPLLGVCLGHQAIGEAFGGKIIGAQTLMHGKVSAVSHLSSHVFQDLPNPVNCRYHSLVIERASLPECLEITAWTDDGEIMGVRHKTLAVEGVQFHPEALLTEHGHQMFANFLQQHA